MDPALKESLLKNLREIGALSGEKRKELLAASFSSQKKNLDFLCFCVVIFSCQWDRPLLRFLISFVEDFGLAELREGGLLFPFLDWFVEPDSDNGLKIKEVPFLLVLRETDPFVEGWNDGERVSALVERLLEFAVLKICLELGLFPLTPFRPAYTPHPLEPPALFREGSHYQAREQLLGREFASDAIVYHDFYKGLLETEIEEREKAEAASKGLRKHVARPPGDPTDLREFARPVDASLTFASKDVANHAFYPPCVEEIYQDCIKNKRHPKYNERTAILIFFVPLAGDRVPLLMKILQSFCHDNDMGTLQEQAKSFLKNNYFSGAGCSAMANLGCCPYYNRVGDIEDAEKRCVGDHLNTRGLGAFGPLGFFRIKRRMVTGSEE